MEEQKIIYVVFKTHFDIGYTELAKEAIERYGRDMLADVAETCEATQNHVKEHRYIWTMPSWPLIQSLSTENADKKVIEKAKALISDGQIAWHALPFTTHTEFCGLEEFIRGLYFSETLSGEYGMAPISAKMTDVPGHTWILPSILFKAGVRFLHLGCNPGCMPPDVPRLFYWEGPDGNKVLTFYSKGAYGSSLIPPGDWPFPVWLALIQTNDNAGPQKPEIIEEILCKVKAEYTDAKVITGTLDDFYQALCQYQQEIPVIRQDLADSWIHGVSTYPGEVSGIRASRNDLLNCEKALSIGNIAGIFNRDETEEYHNKIKKAFEYGLLFGEHTWGLDVKTTMGSNRHYNKELFKKNKNIPIYQRMEESWDEQRQRAHKTAEIIKEIQPGILDRIASAINSKEPAIAAFNFLGWRRNAWVCLDRLEHLISGKYLVDHDSGEVLQTTVIRGSLMVFVKDLPACGYKTLGLRDGKAEPSLQAGIYCSTEKGLLENNWYKIRINRQKGTIESIFEKESCKEWVDPRNAFGFGRYRYDVYGNDDITAFIKAYAYRFYDWLVNDLGRIGYPEQSHLTFVPDHFTIEQEAGTGWSSLKLSAAICGESVVRYGNAAKVTMLITIYAEFPYIDLEYRLEAKEETSYIEAGHFIFPFALDRSQMAINKLGSVIDPSRDIARDANNVLYCCENWVDLTDGKNGMTVIPFDTPLFSVGEEGIYKYRRGYREEAPVLYFNAFNNSWGTNFPQWTGGDFKFRFRLLAHKGDWKQAEIWKHAFESVTPVCTGFTGGTCHKGLPVRFEWIKEPDGMEIMTVKPAENNQGMIIRLREVSGGKHLVRLTFERPITGADFCDLLERFQRTANVSMNTISFITGPFEIHTLRLRL